MNTQLVDSLIQVIRSLPDEERALLGEKLSTADPIEVSTDRLETEEAVGVFLALGRNAASGQLKNTAVNHDRSIR